jgi:ketosteroid isomerase-like protein
LNDDCGGECKLSIEENRRILSDLHAAINSRDVDRAMSLFADDASLIVMPGGTCSSKDDIRKYFEKMMKNYEKIIFGDIHPPVVSGEMATHEFMVDVKLKGGPEGTLPAVVVADFRNGRVTQIRWYLDKLEAAKNLAEGTLAKRAVASVAKRVEALVNP